MYGEVYIDIVFLTNLLLDYFLLRLAGILFKSRTGRLRCFSGALLGAGFSCIVLLFQEEKNFGMTFLLHGICAMGMLRIGCGIKKYSLLVKGTFLLYLVAFLWGGFWDVLLKNTSLTLRTFFFSAIGTYVGLSAMLYLSDSVRTKRMHIYPITLSYQGKIHKAYGYYDTGNFLKDPYSGAPVSVTVPDFLEEILSKDTAGRLKDILEKQGELESTEFISLHPRFIPYRTVGKDVGIMLVITLDELCIHTPGGVIHISKPVLGFAQGPSALEKECKVLLNSIFINQEGN